MRLFFNRSVCAKLALAALTSGLAACTGGGGDTTSPSAVVPAQAASTSFSLGLVEADAGTIAGMTRLRRSQATTLLPPAVDLSGKMPPVGNQGQEGSCVAWATAYAMRGYEARQDIWSTIAPKSTDPTLNFSPAFIYNQLNGGRDAGLTIPSALTLMQQKGAATLADMPYVSGQYTTQPSAAASADAMHYKLATFGYIAPTDLTSMKAQLVAGLPVVLAIKVYNNFFALGNNAIYTSTAGGYAGGHAVTVIGYDDSKQALEIMNSWGPYWGTAGYGWIGYSVLNQIALEAYSAVDDRGLPPTPGTTPKPNVSPTPAPKPSLLPTPAPKPSPLPTLAPKPSLSPTPAPKPSQSPTPAPKPTVGPTTTPKPSAPPVATPAPKPTPTPLPGATPQH